MKLVLGFALLVSWLSAAENTAKFTVNDLAWLAGRWEFEQGGRTVREEWMPPAGGAMPGMSRTVRAGRMVAHEFLLLQADEAGDIIYLAYPSGQKLTAFKLVRLEGQAAVFENKEHDFPQRIGYTLQADGLLLAYIEGEKGGKFRRVEFPYRRVAP